MKEAKFRVWAVGQMHYPDIIIFDASAASFAPAGGGGSFRVPLADVMQSTGLQDKNGRDIYDGDVIKDGAGQSFPVTFGSGGYWFNWLHLVDVLEPWEVVGDIYSNPDLLK